MPFMWHLYYFKNNTSFILPAHSKTIDFLETIYVAEQNKKIKEANEAAKGGRQYKKGDFIPREIGERWQDEKGNQWQTIF